MTGQASLLQSLGWAVLNSLWQLALLWVVYQFITGVFRQLRSSIKSYLASGLLIGGFAWFFITFISTYTNLDAAQPLFSASIIEADGNDQLNKWLQQTLPVASVIYLVLLVLPLLHFIRNYRYVQVIRKYGLTRIQVDWRLFVNRVASHLNIKKPVKIWVSEFVSSPVTVGFLKPVILIPLAAINHLTPQQLEAVILHELAHIKRLDYFINLIINFIQAVLYYNPFVKSLVKIVEREREKSCDEMVLQFQYDSHEYASALLTLEKASHENKILVMPAQGKANDLLHRIELILGIRKKSFISFNKLAGLMAGFLCIISLNALLLFCKPTDGNRTAGFAGLFSAHRVTLQVAKAPVKPELHPVESAADITNTAGKHIEEKKRTVLKADITPVSSNIDPAFISAGLEIVQTPELKQYQQEQVEQALQASKKIMESVQWKTVERNIAEVFNQREKALLKEKYKQELASMDWKKMENQLKLAYDKIDWDNMNYQLSLATNQLRLDSLQRLYNSAAVKLNEVAKELNRYDMQGIPDTDISLKEIEVKKADLQKALTDLKKLRSKKIVHL